MKLCKSCGAKDPALFYGSINTYCKEHWRLKVRQNRVEKIEYYRSFDKLRASMPHRVSAREEYTKTQEGVAAHNKAKFKWSERNKERKRIIGIVNYNVRCGKVSKPDTCQECGKGNCRIEGHHDDYAKPLDVRWLCSACHRAWHKMHGTVELQIAA